MTPYCQIRAQYDRDSITVYQAYSDSITRPSLKAGRFVEPFSWNRMTWIKPSFLWLMARSNWGQKSGQENILGIRIKRTGWEDALSQGVLTSYTNRVHDHRENWQDEFEKAKVHVQWDPERTLHGKKLEHRSIQVGISRDLIREFTNDWILQIEDLTPLTRKIRKLYLAGETRRAKEHLPPEKVYPVSKLIQKRLGMD